MASMDVNSDIMKAYIYIKTAIDLVLFIMFRLLFE